MIEYLVCIRVFIAFGEFIRVEGLVDLWRRSFGFVRLYSFDTVVISHDFSIRESRAPGLSGSSGRPHAGGIGTGLVGVRIMNPFIQSSTQQRGRGRFPSMSAGRWTA